MRVQQIAHCNASPARSGRPGWRGVPPARSRRHHRPYGRDADRRVRFRLQPVPSGSITRLPYQKRPLRPAHMGNTRFTSPLRLLLAHELLTEDHAWTAACIRGRECRSTSGAGCCAARRSARQLEPTLASPQRASTGRGHMRTARLRVTCRGSHRSHAEAICEAICHSDSAPPFHCTPHSHSPAHRPGGQPAGVPVGRAFRHVWPLRRPRCDGCMQSYSIEPSAAPTAPGSVCCSCSTPARRGSRSARHGHAETTELRLALATSSAFSARSADALAGRPSWPRSRRSAASPCLSA